jgi:hypothetical protein
MRNLIIASVLLLGIVSCKAVGEFFGGEDLVVTTADNVAEGVEYAPVPVDQLPDSVQALVPEGTEVVVVPKEALVSEDSQHIPLAGPMGDTAIGTAFDAAMHIGKTFVPALAGWEALLALGFKRKRKHYVKAVKALVPTDKNMDFGGAIAGLTAALGMTHSSPETEEVFDAEEEEEEV